jgi:hypothetical protein
MPVRWSQALNFQTFLTLINQRRNSDTKKPTLRIEKDRWEYAAVRLARDREFDQQPVHDVPQAPGDVTSAVHARQHFGAVGDPASPHRLYARYRCPIHHRDLPGDADLRQSPTNLYLMRGEGCSCGQRRVVFALLIELPRMWQGTHLEIVPRRLRNLRAVTQKQFAVGDLGLMNAE